MPHLKLAFTTYVGQSNVNIYYKMSTFQKTSFNVNFNYYSDLSRLIQ